MTWNAFWLLIALGTILPVVMLVLMKKYMSRFKMPLLGVILLGGMYAFVGAITCAAISGHPLVVIAGGFGVALFGLVFDKDIWFRPKETSV